MEIGAARAGVEERSPAESRIFARTRPKVELHGVSFHYGRSPVLEDVTLDVVEKRITALIGPSGCGKSTLLGTINRTNELIAGCRIDGQVLMDGVDVYAALDPLHLRRRVGMVFQSANPFPTTIYENVAYGLRIHGWSDGSDLDSLVREGLVRVGLWNEVKHKLRSAALRLSGGQQQRLCIARALAVEPELLIMDEPCSALDPISTQRVEDLIAELKRSLTILIVTHNMQQAARASDYTAFLLAERTDGPSRLVEFGETERIFTNPREKRTEDYVTGRFG